MSSAGDHQYRSAKVLFFPSSTGTTITLHVRRHRGAALEWERRIGHLRIPHASPGTWDSLAGALRAAGDGLHALADRLSDRT